MAYSEYAKQTSTARADLIQTLKLDLIGPSNEHQFAREILPEPPDVWYTTGYLIPEGTPVEDRQDQDLDDDTGPDLDPGSKGSDSDIDRMGGKNSFLPASIGLSVLVPPHATVIGATVSWGDYVQLGGGNPDDGHFAMELENWAREVGLEPVPTYLFGASGYARIPREESIELPIPAPDDSPQSYDLGRGRMLSIEIFSRMADGIGLDPGTRSVSIFLINRRDPGSKKGPKYPAIAFQVEMELVCKDGFTPRPNLQAFGNGEREWDERVADLQYRDVHEFVVGHNVSSEAVLDQGRCYTVSSAWFPRAEVEKVEPSKVAGLLLEMEALGNLNDGDQVRNALGGLVQAYKAWIGLQMNNGSNLTPGMIKTRNDLVLKANYACSRIAKGIDLLAADPELRAAFCLANSAMAMSAKQRMKHITTPVWRPFQLAFILLNLAGLANPTDPERETVDLLFFPTGGGKTEAYLGLAAFTLVLRRLRNPETESRGTLVPNYAGMAVLMRYTLRLLTLDQLGRAAALIVALELLRLEEHSVGNTRLGTWPFEIGLWVGSGATPNRLGKQGDKESDASYTAYAKWLGFQNRDKECPIPLRNCPWCGQEFEKDSFRFIGQDGRTNIKAPENFVVHCHNDECATNDWSHLPIVTIDEPIYRRLPSFIIATVDKFAALPWTGQVGMLFGKVNRFDSEQGFFGHSENSGTGLKLEKDLLPPELIIQDELHLISGPLGTIAGIYEIAIEELSTRKLPDGTRIKPKIVASTATVRRAESQIRALFGRPQAEIFPPQGPNRKDSFFAHTKKSLEVPARLYVGIAAPGKSPKAVALQVLLALLSRGSALYEINGGKNNPKNPVDPYLTLMYYFNSLRELGASRNMIEDQVGIRLEGYNNHRRIFPKDILFASREIPERSIQELSSRESTTKIAEAKRRLELGWGQKDHVDIALATNMISVGLDITRLGLMVVNGQPKAAAEYIQSTSRVGRDSERPGLVITLFNCFKPRDRSHYERFTTWHEAFYRAVEATSVTPFAPRAMERALAAALVGLIRHDSAGMALGGSAHTILTKRQELEAWVAPFVDRASIHDNAMSDAERAALQTAIGSQVRSLLDSWEKIAKSDNDSQLQLFYTAKEKRGQAGTALVSAPLEANLPTPVEQRSRFRANRSMRDVQAPVIIHTERAPE